MNATAIASPHADYVRTAWTAYRNGDLHAARRLTALALQNPEEHPGAEYLAELLDPDISAPGWRDHSEDEPLSPHTRAALALLLDRAGQRGDAILHAELALRETAAGSPSIAAELAGWHFCEGDHTRSSELLAEHREAEDPSATVWSYLHVLQTFTRDRPAARRLLDVAHRQAPRIAMAILAGPHAGRSAPDAVRVLAQAWRTVPGALAWLGSIPAPGRDPAATSGRGDVGRIALALRRSCPDLSADDALRAAMDLTSRGYVADSVVLPVQGGLPARMLVPETALIYRAHIPTHETDPNRAADAAARLIEAVTRAGGILLAAREGSGGHHVEVVVTVRQAVFAIRDLAGPNQIHPDQGVAALASWLCVGGYTSPNELGRVVPRLWTECAAADSH